MADLDLNAIIRRVFLCAAVGLLAMVMIGCEDDPPPEGFEKIRIKDQTYTLELAATDATPAVEAHSKLRAKQPPRAGQQLR